MVSSFKPFSCPYCTRFFLQKPLLHREQTADGDRELCLILVRCTPALRFIPLDGHRKIPYFNYFALLSRKENSFSSPKKRKKEKRRNTFYLHNEASPLFLRQNKLFWPRVISRTIFCCFCSLSFY